MNDFFFILIEFQTVNRPDSGIGDGFDSDGPLQVNLPPETSSKPINLRNPLLNPSFADSREASRESSIEDLSGSFYENVKSTNLVDDKGYSKGVKFFRRKKSGDSQVNNDSNDEEDEEPKSDTRKKTRYGRQTSKDSQKSGKNQGVSHKYIILLITKQLLTMHLILGFSVGLVSGF